MTTILDRVLPAPVAAPPPTQRVQGNTLIPLVAFGVVFAVLRRWWT